MLPVRCDERMNVQQRVSAASPLLSSSDTRYSPFHFLSLLFAGIKLQTVIDDEVTLQLVVVVRKWESKHKTITIFCDVLMTDVSCNYRSGIVILGNIDNT